MKLSTRNASRRRIVLGRAGGQAVRSPRAPRCSRIRALPLLLALALAGGAFAQTIVVSAASSLTESFQELVAIFEARHEGAQVDLNFGGSSTLAAQITQGAPVSVFASANEAQMNVVVAAGLVEGEPSEFARNRLVVVTPPGSPVRALEDLAAEGVTLVLAGPEVPVGAYARAALNRMNAVFGAGFERAALANVVSEEFNVRLVAAKIELGEADAAIVYATDAIVVRGVETIRIDDAVNVPTSNPIAVIKDGPHLELARAFVALVLSAEGQALLATYGFGTAE